MDSIMQNDENTCYLCGEAANGDNLDWHHCFGGAMRKKSEKYGLKVKLHHNQCHIFGRDAVHNNAENMRLIQQEAQRVIMQSNGWTIADFRREFYKNYLEGEENV